jgi:hypothetical protein
MKELGLFDGTALCALAILLAVLVGIGVEYLRK